jgi:hypothetical protein
MALIQSEPIPDQVPEKVEVPSVECPFNEEQLGDLPENTSHTHQEGIELFLQIFELL